MSSPCCPNMPISKEISRTTSSNIPRKSRTSSSRQKTAVLPRPPGLELAVASSNLAQPIPGQAAQILGCLHLQHRREMLLGWRHVAGSTGEGEAVYGSAGPGDRTPWSGADSPWKAYQSRCWSLSKTMHHVIPAVLSCCPLDLGCIYAAIRPIL